MRIWLLALMIALLPLRGWVGDAMAGQMLAQRLVALQAAPAVQHADCPGHAQDAAAPATAASMDHGAAGATDCGTCTACQVCHSTAFVGAPGLAPVLAAFVAAPASASEAFTSTDPLAGFKPPKS